jgi:hypothetical protein
MSVLWLLVLLTPMAIAFFEVNRSADKMLHSEDIASIGVGIGAVLVVTVLFGATLGYESRWLEALIAAACGDFLLVITYVLFALSTPADVNHPDPGLAAAVGALLLALPSFLVLGVLLLLGALVGRVFALKVGRAR